MNTDSNNLKTKLLLTILTPFPYLFPYIPYRPLRSDYCSPSSFGPANFHDSAVSLTIFQLFSRPQDSKSHGFLGNIILKWNVPLLIWIKTKISWGMLDKCLFMLRLYVLAMTLSLLLLLYLIIRKKRPFDVSFVQWWPLPWPPRVIMIKEVKNGILLQVGPR